MNETPMVQKADDRLNSDAHSSKPIGCRRGCLLILITLLAIYVIHALFLIVPNTINKAKWHNRGSTNYKYTISKFGLLPPDIQNGRIVTVRDGEIVQITNVSLALPVYVPDIETIDQIFNGVYACSILFPLNTCSYEYNPYYGYPSVIKVNCPIPDACYTDTVITDVEILSP
jgi:hypothetical protein